MATPDIKTIKLGLLRGTEAQRTQIILDEGELGYTTDTKRLFVGDGANFGGNPTSSKISTNIANYTSLSDTPALVGDVVVADKVAYQLRYSSWEKLSSWEVFTSPPDNTYISFTGLSSGNLTLKNNGVDGTKLNQQLLSSTSIKFNSNSIVVNYDTSQFTISGDLLAINQNGIKPIHIAKETISSGTKGLSGGDGEPLFVSVDGATIDYDIGGRLTVISTPITAIGYDNLGAGFDIDTINSKVSTLVTGVDSRNFALCGGLVTWTGDLGTLVDPLSADDSTTDTFNGSPGQSTSGYVPVNGIVTINAKDTTGTTQVLSSAGFMVYEGNSLTNNQRYAVPIFLLPTT